MNPAARLFIAGGSSHPGEAHGLMEEHPKGSWIQVHPEAWLPTEPPNQGELRRVDTTSPLVD